MAKTVGTTKEVSLEAVLAGEATDEQLKALSFEQSLKLLEQVVAAVENGSLPLDGAIGAYEKGSVLVQQIGRAHV